MFSPQHWSRDPYHRFKSAIPFSPFQSHTFSHNLPYAKTHSYQPRENRRRHATENNTKPLHPQFNTEPPDLSEQSDFETDTDSTLNDRMHASYYPLEPEVELASQFKRMQVRIPKRVARELRSSEEILILPSSLTHLKISLYAQHASRASRTVRAAVAGDMRLRDVVKQVLPQEYLPDARVYVRLRGEWVEPGAPTKISDIAELGRFAVNDGMEVEVKLVIGGDRERETGRAMHGGRARRHSYEHGWERERRGIERMRVF